MDTELLEETLQVAQIDAWHEFVAAYFHWLNSLPDEAVDACTKRVLWRMILPIRLRHPYCPIPCPPVDPMPAWAAATDNLSSSSSS